MKKLLLVSLCFLMLSITQVFAQNRTVTGTVTAKDDGLPIPGVTVKVKGTAIGTQTNSAGKYTLSVPAGATLVFTFVGYSTEQLPVGNGLLNVVLHEASNSLGEVVVTGALGIKKAEREVGYATTRVSNASLTQTAPIDVVNGLTGKAPGLVIEQTSDGVNPSVRINLRGNRSISGYNQALIVIDGSPVSAAIFENLNPDDIEDINILNGSGAAALYGSQASNGALVITTKRGSNNGQPTITYNNSFQLEQVVNFPKFQTQFGQYGGEGSPFINPLTGFPENVNFENQQYGPQFDGSTVDVGVPVGSPNGPQLTAKYSPLSKSPIESFFQLGSIEQNNVSFREGNADNGFSLTARDVYNKGYVPMDNSRLDNVRVSGDRTYGIFKIDYSASYTKSLINQEGNQGYDGSNLMGNLYQFPQFLNINNFKDATNGQFANPSDYFSAYSINPWWIIENSRNVIQKDQFQGSFDLSLKPTKWLDLDYRVDDSFGTYRNTYTQNNVTWSAYALTYPQEALNGVNEAYLLGAAGVKGQVRNYIGYGDGSGTIINTAGNNPLYAGDQGLARLEGTFTLNLHKTFFNDWKTNLLLGNSIWSETGNYTYDASSNLATPGYYNVNDIIGIPVLHQASEIIRQVSNFADANIGYKTYAFLEGTLRNDNDSRLTPGQQSLWYPSGKISIVPTEFISGLKDNSILNYAKFYLNVSKVGLIDLAPYPGAPSYNVTSGFPYNISALSQNTTYYPNNLKPQSNYETEVGADLGFFKDRLHLTATLQISTSAATGYLYQDVNAGEIDSYGEEFSAQGIIFPTAPHSVGWTVGGNFSIYQSKVVSLLPGQNQLDLGDVDNVNGQVVGGTYAIVGKSYPQLLVTDYARDSQGRVIVNSSGYPTTAPNLRDEGTVSPKFDLGLNTDVSYSFVSLHLDAEYRGGNVMYNETGSAMDFGGTSAISAEAGRQIFIYPNSVINTGTATSPVYTPNTTVPVARGGWEFWSTYPVNTGSPYVYSGAFWRLREADIRFNLNRFVKNSKAIKGLTVSLTGRNLFLWVPKSNMYGDPELSDAGSTGNNIGTSSTNGIPTPRIYGADLQVTF